MHRLVLAALVLALAGLPGCMGAASPAQRLTDAANELNTASQFGRNDIALGLTARGAQRHFVLHRQGWGKEVRIVDLELSGMNMPDEDHATVQVNIAWVRMSEGTLRATQVAQEWRTDDEDRGGWVLVRERRVAGDLGLFGEPIPQRTDPPHDDVHFPSRSLGTSSSPDPGTEG